MGRETGSRNADGEGTGLGSRDGIGPHQSCLEADFHASTLGEYDTVIGSTQYSPRVDYDAQSDSRRRRCRTYSCCRGLHPAPSSNIAASSALTPATLHAHLAHGTLTLRGSLPSEASKAAILQPAQELYGTAPGRVVDELAVDPKVGPASWADNDAKVLPVLGHMTERGSIIIDGRTVVLSGRVDNDRAKAAVLREIVPLTQAGLELEDHILAVQFPASSPRSRRK